jgi:hypothetical protein
MSTLNLINAIEAGKTRESEATFAALVQSRVEDAIEYRRMEIGQSMFQAVDESTPQDDAQ